MREQVALPAGLRALLSSALIGLAVLGGFASTTDDSRAQEPAPTATSTATSTPTPSPTPTHIPAPPGAIRIDKLDANTNTLVGGACFTVAPNPFGEGEYKVCDDGVGDYDFTPGRTELLNVPVDNYSITENSPPPGYAPSADNKFCFVPPNQFCIVEFLNSSFTPTPTDTPPPPVGGIALDPDLGALPLESPASSGGNAGALAGAIAAAAAAVVALGGAGWYARRRLARR